MKTVILLAVAISAAVVFGGQKTDRLMRAAQTMSFSEEELLRLRAAAADYEEAERRLLEIRTMMGLYSRPTNRMVINMNVKDPTIRQLEAQWAKSRNRFKTMNATIRRYGPSTNLHARVARSSMQERLDQTRAERDQAKAEAKKAKELEKAAIKFGKNLDKERKNFEKYRDKAKTDEERAFWQALLDFLPVPNEEK